MIIDDGIVKSKGPEVNCYENTKFQVYFQGLIYIPYIKNGIESIKKILTGIKNHKISNVSDIRGNYFLFIIDKINNYKYVFVDNSGLFKVYKHKNVISTSLLELAKYLNFDHSKLNFNAVVEFLHFGVTNFWHTLFKDTRRIDKNEIIVFHPTNKQTAQDKRLAKINQPINLNIFDFFKGFYETVKEKKISFDLTGGVDTRLIVSLFSHLNVDFELAVSGLKGNKDIDIPAKISSILKKNFFVTYHNIEDISGDSLKTLFYLTDGQIDLIRYHRRYQLTMHRKKRGIDLQIGGIGGELYKDIWWLQDFPFYCKKKINIEKLYDLRIESVIYPHHQLGEKTRLISRNLRNNTIEKLCAYKLGTNTQTFDNICYNHRIQSIASTYNTIGNHLMETYAPLVEPDLVRFGFGLKRSKRFFNNFHREMISLYCPAISRINTTESVTCSSRMIDKLKDIVPYVFDKQKRLVKQILRKLVKKTYLQENPTDSRIYKKVAGLELFKEQISILKDYGIIAKDLNIENIRNADIGKFLVIGLLLRELQ